MNTKITIASIAVVVIVIVCVAAFIVFDGSDNNDSSDNPSDPGDSTSETVPLFDADVGSVLNYTISGTYRNYLMQPMNITGNYTMTITYADDTTIVAERSGSYTIIGLGQTYDMGQTMTYLRSDLNQVSPSTTTISTSFGQKEVYVFTETTHSGPGNIYTNTYTTYRGIDDGISYRQTVNTSSTGNYESVSMTVTLSSFTTIPYNYEVA